jgi:pyruvate carboxylase subunit B
MADYTVTLEGKELRVSLRGGGIVEVGEAEGPVRLRSLGKHRFLVMIGDATYYVVAARQDGEYHLMLDGRHLSASVESDRDRLLRAYAREGGDAHHRTEIHAPMPALVVDVEVAVGDEVKPGQGLVILEAMKMENEIKAHQSGTVKEVRVEKGKTVEKGALLILLE